MASSRLGVLTFDTGRTAVVCGIDLPVIGQVVGDADDLDQVVLAARAETWSDGAARRTATEVAAVGEDIDRTVARMRMMARSRTR